MNDNKKPFDSTVCFTFYGSWVRAIEQLETEAEESSLAYKRECRISCVKDIIFQQLTMVLFTRYRRIIEKAAPIIRLYLVKSVDHAVV